MNDVGDEEWRKAFRCFRLREKDMPQQRLADISGVSVGIIANIEDGGHVSPEAALCAIKNCFGFDDRAAIVRAYRGIPVAERERALARFSPRSNKDVNPEHRLAFRKVLHARGETLDELTERVGQAKGTVLSLIRCMLMNELLTVHKVESFTEKAWGIPTLTKLVEAAAGLDDPDIYAVAEQFPEIRRPRFVDFAALMKSPPAGGRGAG